MLENSDKCVISMDLVVIAQLGIPFVIAIRFNMENYDEKKISLLTDRQTKVFLK